MSFDIALFVAIAEIAGVFVGFAALISVTGRDEVSAAQLAQVRAVVTIGLVVIVAALVPIALDSYGMPPSVLWRISGLLFLALVWVVIVLALRRRENRDTARAQARKSPGVAIVFWGVLEVAIQVPLVLVAVGAFTDFAPALYTTALVVHLFEAASVLQPRADVASIHCPATCFSSPRDSDGDGSSSGSGRSRPRSRLRC